MCLTSEGGNLPKLWAIAYTKEQDTECHELVKKHESFFTIGADTMQLKLWNMKT